MTGIYVISATNKTKVYIGSAVNISKRLSSHRHYLRKGNHHNSVLQNYFNKYGSGSLKYSLLYECSIENLLESEQFFLNLYEGILFNIRKIAESNIGVKLSEETVARMSQAQQNRSSVTIQRMSDSAYGRVHSEETKQKLSKINKGRKLSEETRKKMSDSRKGRVVSEETRKKIANSNLGQKRSDETCRNIGLSSLGRYQSEETRRKRSEALKGRVFSDDHKRKISESLKGKPKTKQNL